MSHPTPLVPAPMATSQPGPPGMAPPAPGAAMAPTGLLVLGDSALTTYRWLRVGLLLALATICTSIAIEWARVPGHCFQGSISEYYWTPVRPLFVGGMFVMAFGLVCVRGNSPVEDVALNLAGLMAPIVAVVPMRPHTGCSSAPQPLGPVEAAADNNVRALLAAALVALVGVTVSMVRHRVRRRSSWTGLALGFATVLGFGLWCLFGIDSLVPAAHYVAAIGLFTCLGFVVGRNARETPHQPLTPLYAGLAVAMAVAVVLQVVTLLLHLHGWGLLATEVVLMGSFALFWAVQTAELWHQGVRRVPCRP